jgi:hypothetical protein
MINSKVEVKNLGSSIKQPIILKKSVEHNPAKNIQHKLDGQWVVMSRV